MFKDRRDAGRKLAERLASYRGTDATVIALPRGGVVVGHEVACDLGLPLDVIITRKIPHPMSPEYAVGVVDEGGTAILNESETAILNEGWLKKEITAEMAEAHRRNLLYRKGKEPLDLAGQVAILVDDGIATGFTIDLAIEIVKKWWPEKVVVAVPVASLEAAERIKGKVDKLVVLQDPHFFGRSVGSHYEKFEQVSDDEVVALLHSNSLLMETGTRKTVSEKDPLFS